MHERIPLFDCLTHPTIDGRWLDGGIGTTFEGLLAEMDLSGVSRALAVGMKGVGSYDVEKFAISSRDTNGRLLPIAWKDVDETESNLSIKNELLRLQRLGYVGIKLHPRMGQFTLGSSALRRIIQHAGEINLVVLLCTYLYGCTRSECNTSLDHLPKLLADIQLKTRLVLLHGGVVRLLEVSEMIRNYPSVVLDLSFTICRYEGSSLDCDIAWLFKNFDRRICVGSDSPQFTLTSLRRRFEYFAAGISVEKARNIAHRNLENQFGHLEQK
jgi:predicted TIM-barrel fold metal-dependent hydrolase